MSHNALIGGTAYKIKGGRDLVDGTGYNLKKGRTLIDGTGYDVDLKKYPTNGLVHEYLFDGNFNDSVGNSNLTVENVVGVFETDSGRKCFKCTNLLYYQGYLRNVGGSGTTVATVSIWVKSPYIEHSASHAFICNDVNYFSIAAGDTIWQENWFRVASCGCRIRGVNTLIRTIDQYPPFQNFVHLVFSIGPDNVKFYMNNNLYTVYSPGCTGYVYAPNFDNPFESAYLAFQNGDQNSNMRIAELRIYNRQLSDEEISALYNNGQGV